MARKQESPRIPGYDYGADTVACTPLSNYHFQLLEDTVDLNAEDWHFLGIAADVLADQAEGMVDLWFERISAQRHLAESFHGPDGNTDERYKAAVKPRFVKWVRDLCTRPHDREWLDYQEEIALRHTPAKKNKTDGVDAPNVVPLRYLLTFTAVIILTAKPFLANKGHGPEVVERMHAAWTKAVLISVALWTRPYTKEGLW